VFGRTLHISVQDAQRAQQNIKQAFKKSEIEIERLEKIEPSMEDVFVALIEREERDE
jgi:ABC-2 type transport system ATP-binding protein